MGKTLFFRSGGHPLILSEEQREERKIGEDSFTSMNSFYYTSHLTLVSLIFHLNISFFI